MPWKVTQPVSQRMLFIADYVRQEKSVAELCRLYGISRKTGHKWINRIHEEGEASFAERSRAPHRCANRLDPHLADQILALRAEHATWGPRKLRARLARLHPETHWPAPSTIGQLLRRNGLIVARRRRPRAPASGVPLTQATVVNQVWNVDFKGHFTLGDGSRCTPLTITDGFSRYLLRCLGLGRKIGTAVVQPLFEAAFREWGLPSIIRSDNGSPFASTGLAGLTRLSVWWTKLGIVHERIAPGHPEQNGAHERMHRTLKAETTRPPAPDLPRQQQRFDRFMTTFNHERPHEAIAMATPADLHRASPRTYPRPFVEPVQYPHGWMVRKVKDPGCIKWGGHLVRVTEALTGEHVGLAPEAEDGCWTIYFGSMRLAHFDERDMLVSELEVDE